MIESNLGVVFNSEDDLRLRILERMGGDTYNVNSITTDELIESLKSLQDREFLCGAYWILTFFVEDVQCLHELSTSQTRDDIYSILKKYKVIS